MTLQNCAPTDYANPALPMPSPDQPAYLDDLAPCPACRNSGETCGWCGGGGYGDEHQPAGLTAPRFPCALVTDGGEKAEPLPTIATIELSDPNHTPEKLYRCEECNTLFALEEGDIFYDDDGEFFVCSACTDTGEE